MDRSIRRGIVKNRRVVRRERHRWVHRVTKATAKRKRGKGEGPQEHEDASGGQNATRPTCADQKATWKR